jgi:lysophospholipase L1-like esterase
MHRSFQVLCFCFFAGLQVHAASPDTLGKFVVVGDSLSAGFQNFSLYTSETAGKPSPLPGMPAPVLPLGGQEHGYAQLIALQAGTNLQNPTVLNPGIPPTLITADKGKHIARYPGFGGRLYPSAPTLNFSVPSYTVADALGRQVDLYQVLTNPLGANPQDVLAFTVLGVPNSCGVLLPIPLKVTLSSVDCAVQAQPKTILVSLGSNDALQSLTFGVDPTPEDAFRASYHELISRLDRTNARMILANVPDITLLPYLWSRADFIDRCGSSALPAGTKSNDFLVPNLVDPRTSGDVCTSPVVRSKQSVQAARHAAAKFNKIISDEAKALNDEGHDDARAIILDIDGLFSDIAKKGVDIGGKHLTTAFLGGLFSLDGMHPTNTGNAIIANEAIQTMNNAWHTSIPTISLDGVAATDPLIF